MLVATLRSKSNDHDEPIQDEIYEEDYEEIEEDRNNLGEQEVSPQIKEMRQEKELQHKKEPEPEPKDKYASGASILDDRETLVGEPNDDEPGVDHEHDNGEDEDEEYGAEGEPRDIMHERFLRRQANRQQPMAYSAVYLGLSARRTIAYAIYVFLAVTGAYIAFFGLRVFRLLMIILGFYVSYYTILFVLTELTLYRSDCLAHQLALFFSCMALGVVFAILCYFYESANFIIFGVSISTVLALFYAQFFVNFSDPELRNKLLWVHAVSSVVCSTAAFFILDQAIILGSALVGSAITVINVGVILGDFRSFEDRTMLPDDRISDFWRYLVAAAVMFLAGASTQYYIRKRILDNFVARIATVTSDISLAN